MALKIIRIPRTPKSAFKKGREMSTLLQSQVAHVVEAEQRLPQKQRTSVDAEAIATEHEAAEYVGSVMKRLMPKARKTWKLPPGRRAPKSGVWLGPAKRDDFKKDCHDQFSILGCAADLLTETPVHIAVGSRAPL